MEDFTASPTAPVIREFLAVILSGFGNELLPLTSDHGDEPCPKALMPIALKPVIDFPLEWIEASGVKDVLIICPTTHRHSIYHHIHSDLSSPLSSLRIDIQTAEETPENIAGTCALLKQFSNRIKDDFILLPCDFISPTTLSLSSLLNKFRIESMEGAIVTSCWFKPSIGEKGAFSDNEYITGPSTSPIVWDDQTGTLVHIDTLDDTDHNSDEIELRMSLLNRYPRTKLSAKFQDTSVYVCKHSVLDLLQLKPAFYSFREEFIPWLCKVQHQKLKRQKYGPVLSPITNNATSQDKAFKHSTIRETRCPPEEDSEEDAIIESSLKVGVIIHHDSEFASRVNTISAFMDANRKALSKATYTFPTDPKDRSLIDQKSMISTDTIIGESTQVSERASIKKSVIGRHCVIGKMTKIVGCVLLDHCVVADGARLESCILGKNTKIGAKCDLSRCVTQAGYEAAPGETIKNEKLEISDWAAAPIEDDESEEEESEEGEEGEGEEEKEGEEEEESD